MHAQDTDGDLTKVWKLFEAINAGVQAGDNSITETKRLFNEASLWLDKKLRSEKTPNGTS